MENLIDYKLFGVYAYDSINFANLIIRFLFNLLVTGFIIYYFYYRKAQRKDYLMTFSLISMTVFFLVILLDNVKLQVGFALGLFAIFGIIRYRTITIPIKEMTYLFVIIGLTVINALANKKISYAELLFTNTMFIILCWIFESDIFIRHISTKMVIYDNVKLVKAGKDEELKADLENRLGLKIIRIEIGTVDYIKDSAILTISYASKEVEENTADLIDKYRQ
ncbi:MAG: DUF4956 domain-containing protein [Porphyromonadaceae bacterium]|nr:DUF4956 domain-containing protein [Porphyromonadaceae bacterium]